MSGRSRMLGFALAAGLAVTWPGPAGADVRIVEAVGAVPLYADASNSTPPREAAVRRGLIEAVRRVALEMLPDVDPHAAIGLLDESLGGDPLAYTRRFHIVEDRGARPALFTQDAEVENEYVVLVSVEVDADRVARSLSENGLLVVPSGEAVRVHVRLEIEELTSYAAYRELRRVLLDEVGVRSAMPLEMERGRAVLEVDGDLEAFALLEELLRVAPPELDITTLSAPGSGLRLRVALRSEQGIQPGPATGSD